MRILVVIAHTGRNVEVVLNRIGNNNSEGFGNFHVRIDTFNGPANFAENYQLADGSGLPNPLSVIIGHELGHAVLGYRDPVLNYREGLVQRQLNDGVLPVASRSNFTIPGNNVRYVENPLRRELGLPIRPSYASPYYVRRAFPEIFE